MVETNPLKWFIRDIDIGDSGKKGGPGSRPEPRPAAQRSGLQSGGQEGSNPPPSTSTTFQDKPNMFGHRIVRTRSRHDCHFATGASVPMGKQTLLLLHSGIFHLNSFLFFYHFFGIFCSTSIFVHLYRGACTFVFHIFFVRF